MAIVFHSVKYGDIKLNSHMIIGIAGDDVEEFLKELTGNNLYYLGSDVINSSKSVLSILKDSNEKKLDEYLGDLGLNKTFLDKKINKLSHSEERLLKYLCLLTIDPSIIIVYEPFQDLDYDAKKRIIALFKKLVKKKTIIIASRNTDVIYTQCKKVLLLNKKKYLYDDVVILANKSVLKRFHLKMPEILEFIRLANDKKVKLPYSNDVRDLIKDVYKHVSK